MSSNCRSVKLSRNVVKNADLRECYTFWGSGIANNDFESSSFHRCLAMSIVTHWHYFLAKSDGQIILMLETPQEMTCHINSVY
jgi:hypothetical protein